MTELIEEVVEQIDALENVRVCPCCGDASQVSVASAHMTDIAAHRNVRDIDMKMHMFCGNCSAEFEVSAHYEAQESGFRLLRGRE